MENNTGQLQRPNITLRAMIHYQYGEKKRKKKIIAKHFK